MTKTPEELTKEWKEGKLKSGLYWVKFKGKIVIAECTVFGDVSRPFEIETKTDFMIKISKVLAPVPTYDEYKAMQVELAEHRENCSVKNERAGLRALLKECHYSIFKIYDRLRFSDENEITPADLINAIDEIKPMLFELLTRINAALGESEE